MPSISQKVRTAIVTQLRSDPVKGFNPRLATVAAGYGTTPWSIDFSDASQNFLFGRVDPVALDKSSSLTYPLVTLDTQRSLQTNLVKFAVFAGPIYAVIDVHHSWDESEAIADFASYVDATEDAMVGTLNDQTYQTWPGNLLWNGKVSTNRGNVTMGGYHWRQTMTFVLEFNLVTL
jgi:hypothetical protein